MNNKENTAYIINTIFPNNNSIRDTNYNIGHRQRLISRLKNNGHESLEDYEIVEMMLFLIFKRKDTKPLAKMLLQKFGSLDRIISASKNDLLEIKGLGESSYNSIKIIEAILKSCLKHKIIKKDVIKNFQDIINYCNINMKNIRNEELRVIFIDGINQIIDDKIVRKGDSDSIDIYPKEILKICLEIESRGIILIHNHPSGDPTPSISDIRHTEKIKESCNIINVKLLDHIIIGNGRYISFRSLKLL